MKKEKIRIRKYLWAFYSGLVPTPVASLFFPTKKVKDNPHFIY